jgi:hypothetical protein
VVRRLVVEQLLHVGDDRLALVDRSGHVLLLEEGVVFLVAPLRVTRAADLAAGEDLQ